MLLSVSQKTDNNLHTTLTSFVFIRYKTLVLYLHLAVDLMAIASQISYMAVKSTFKIF
jgi:hypothetical protein